MGRDVAEAARGAVEAADSVSTDRPLRADAVRNRGLLIHAAAAAFAARRRRGAPRGHRPRRRRRHRHPLPALPHARLTRRGGVPPRGRRPRREGRRAPRHPPARPGARGVDAALRPPRRHQAGHALGAQADAAAPTPRSSPQTKGRATAAATKLLEAGVAAGTVRADVTGADLLRAVGGICMSTDQERARRPIASWACCSTGCATGPPPRPSGRAADCRRQACDGMISRPCRIRLSSVSSSISSPSTSPRRRAPRT